MGPVGTIQGAGRGTAVPTYIMWLMAAIKIVEATANIKKNTKKNTTPQFCFSHFAKNRTYRASFLVQ